MARIRTIKPEFPQSESMGRVSRDARLLFAMLWTIADDEGRARGASRLLASLLYPYDDDAAGLIDGWLAELEAVQCIRRYEVDRTRYLEITNWLEHQKIDRPSKSRLPAFEEASRVVANIREASTTDLGPRTLDQDLGSTADARARESEKPPGSQTKLPHWPMWLEIAASIGVEIDDPNWFAQHGRVEMWLNKRWDLQLDILPTIARLMAARQTKGGRPVRRLEYFEPAIADCFASRTAPVPIGTPEKRDATNSRSGVIDAADRLVEQLRSFDQPAPGDSELRGGAGAAAVRAIPQG